MARGIALDHLIARVSLWMSRLGGVMLLAAALLIAFDIAARRLWLLPFNVGTELGAYALAAGASWSFAHALLQRAHIRIDVLYRPVPPILRAGLDVIAMLALVGFALILVVQGWTTFATSVALSARENTPLGTPLAVPQGLWLFGLGWFALVALHRTAKIVLSLLRGDLDSVTRLAGPAGIEEELDEALADAGARLARGT